MAKIGRMVKDLALKELGVALKERPSFFVASLGGLPASEVDGLRKKLRGANARVVAVKRTLGLRSLPVVGADGLKDFFQGAVSLVLAGEDVVPAAKLLIETLKANPEKMAVRGGMIEGQVLGEKAVQELARLPGKTQLIAELIGCIESPIMSIIFTIENLLGEIAWIAEAASKTRPQQANDSPPPAAAPSAAA